MLSELSLKNIERAEQMHQGIADELAGIHDSDDRLYLFAAFVSVVMSHHEAILTLLKYERLTGSALALFRPLLEAAYRGLFTGFLATPRQLEVINEGGTPYGTWTDLAASLDELFEYDGVFAQYSGTTWKTLCGYTHTGIEQLGSRIRPDGKVESSYEEDEINDLINSSTAAVVMTCIPFLEVIRGRGGSDVARSTFKRLYPVPESDQGPLSV
ncbi:DUF6988 family protein [Tunturiibacter psychrotolerans]|uniref:DUF6988 family protein n=1 Tax=Tunturiibacter psychrotolerans TaxID=3069686 RepID=UPI003D1DD272